MKKQLGVTVSGLLMVSVVLVLVAILGFKLFTPYSEYFSIQKVFRSLAIKPEVREGGKREFNAAWASYAQIERISAINGDDIEITKEGSNVIISANYTVKVPLFKNISLVIDFSPSSGPTH
jgi:hypothetical protein